MVQNGNVGGVKTLKLLFPAKKETTFFCRRGFVSGLCNLLVCAFACGSRACAVAVGVRSGAEVLGVATFHLFFRFSFSVSSLKVQFLAVWLDDELNQKIKFHLVSTIIRC